MKKIILLKEKILDTASDAEKDASIKSVLSTVCQFLPFVQPWTLPLPARHHSSVLLKCPSRRADKVPAHKASLDVSGCCFPLQVLPAVCVSIYSGTAPLCGDYSFQVD